MTRFGLFGVVLLFLFSIDSGAQGQGTFWVGPTVGVWSDPLNWSSFNPLPGPGVDVLVDNSHPQHTTAIVDVNCTIDQLLINGDDTVEVAPGIALTVDIDSYLYGPGLLILDPGSSLRGAAPISQFILMNCVMNADSRISTAGTLQLIDMNIVGEGTFGDGGGAQTNSTNSRITANVLGRTLRINAPPISFVNGGTLTALLGGKLELLGKFENGGSGQLQATGGTISLLNASTISGGTFNSAGGGRVAVGDMGAANVMLKDVTNDGTALFTNASIVSIDSSMLNQGTILMTNVGGATPTINGNGFRLTNAFNGTISGRGRIGVNELAATNSGTIEANGAGAILVIDPPNVLGGFINIGTLNSVSGGILRLTGAGGGTFSNNPSSILSAGAGATIELISGAFIDQGRFINGGGIVRLPSSTGTATLKDVTNEGTISTGATTGLTIEGNFANSGWLNIGTTSAGVASLIPGGLLDVTLSGDGTISLVNEATSRITGVNRLINSSNLIQGAGKIGMDTMPMTNSGTIDANIAGKVLEIDPPLLINGFENIGYVRASNGGIVRLIGTDGFFLSSGTYDVRTASTLEVTADAIVGIGWLSNDGIANLNSASSSISNVSGGGTLNVNGGTLTTSTLFQGTLTNDGRIKISSSGAVTYGISGSGTLEVSHATLTAQSIRQNMLIINSPGGSSLVEIPTSGNSTTGTSKVQFLSINVGDRLELNNNALIIESSSPSVDQFIYRDQMLGGRITSQLPGSTAAEDAIGIAPLSGNFRGLSIGGEAVCIAVSLRGDGNLSGNVDSVDFNYFTNAIGYGMTGYFSQWLYGDYNYDFRIDTQDFNYLAGNFGQAMPSLTLGAVVPEPNCVLAVLGLFRLGLRKSRMTSECPFKPTVPAQMDAGG